MTHAEALRGNTAGLPLSACPGELAVHNEHRVDAPGFYFENGRVTTRQMVVTIFRCAACGAIVSSAEGTVLNCYMPSERDPVLAARVEGRLHAAADVEVFSQQL